jgi:hypothetical protein
MIGLPRSYRLATVDNKCQNQVSVTAANLIP